MAEDFNPYWEWLGLDRQLLHPDYYQLLGVSRSESNPAAISAAAERASARVRSFRPGPQAARWSQLLEEIAAAKRCLTDVRLRAAYDGRPVGERPAPLHPPQRPAPRPGRRQDSAAGLFNASSPSPSPAVPAVPLVRPAPRPATALPVGGAGLQPTAPVALNRLPAAIPKETPGPLPTALPVAQPVRPAAGALPRTAPIAATRPRRQSNSLACLAATVGAAMLLIAAGLLLMLTLGSRETPVASTTFRPPPPADPQVAQSRFDRPSSLPGPRVDPGTPPTGVLQPPAPAEQPASDVPAGDVLPSGVPAGDVQGGVPPAEGGELPARGPIELAAQFGTVDELHPSPAADGSATPPIGSIPQPAPADRPSTSTTPPPPPASAESAKTPAAGAPAEAQQPAAAPTEAELEALTRAWAAARTALHSHQFDLAMAELQRVEQLPMTTEQSQRHQRLHLLAQYAKNFHTAFREAIGGMQGGDDIPVGGSAAVGFVQAGGDQITLRVEGANRVWAIDRLPPALTIAIADRQLSKSDPVSLVLKAAYLATLRPSREEWRAKAREWLLDAARQGVELGELHKVLDELEAAPPS